MEHVPWRWSDPASIGRILSAARKRAGLGQADLARRLGFSAANISRIEHGSDLRVSTLIELARVLGFEPMLVPKAMVPAIRALLEEPSGSDRALERGRFT
jgi:transcriptional regulator with XRE-family HTH domain